MKRPKRIFPNIQAFLENLSREGVTQREFAARVGISQQFLCDIKKRRGYPSLTVAKRLSDECGVPIESFLKNGSGS